MHCLQRLSFVIVLGLLSGCETGIESDAGRERTSDREARYGLRPAPDGESQSQTDYIAPRETSNPSVRLKPFRSAQSSNRVQASPTPKPKITPSPTPKPKPAKPKPETVGVDPSITEPAPKPTPAADNAPPPFASPVPGKKGYVTSPYSPDAGFIDVTGLEPGSLAKDPYSGKVFRVP